MTFFARIFDCFRRCGVPGYLAYAGGFLIRDLRYAHNHERAPGTDRGKWTSIRIVTRSSDLQWGDDR